MNKDEPITMFSGDEHKVLCTGDDNCPYCQAIKDIDKALEGAVPCQK